MMESVRVPLRRVLVAGALIVLVGGCSDGNESADTTGDTAQAASAADAPDDSAPPKLPRRWSDMASSAIIQHANSHGYREAGRTQTTHRKCDGDTVSTECNLTITPVRGVRRFNPATVDSNGVIIGQIRNVGTKGEAHLGIPRGETRYWLVVREGAVLKSYLLNLAEANPRKQNEANFLECPKPHHDRGPTGPSKAEFRRCPDPTRPGVAPDTMAFTDHTSPPWTTCSLGCCYADLPEGGGG